MTKVNANLSKYGQRAYRTLNRSTLTPWTVAILNPSVSTGAFLRSLISCGKLGVLMRKRNVTLSPSVPYLNHPPVPLSSSLPLALWVRRSDQFSVQDYTFFSRQTSSLISSTSFSGPKKRPGTTVPLGRFLGTARHSCGTYFCIPCGGYPTDFGTQSLQILDQVVRSSGCPDFRPTQREARLQRRHGPC